MAEFIIQGGRPIQGRHRVPGNKNAALPMLAACTLTDEPVTIANLPLINDVQSMLDILADLGASVELHGHTATICCAGMRKRTIDPALCRRVRTSILFAGPMVARHGKVILHPPGGDVIGRRRLDTHFDGLRDLGVEIDVSEAYRFSCGALVGADILLDEASVTATENLVMAAVLAEGRTTLFNAACEPHVQQLCRMLNEMGASIDGVGTNRLEIGGVSELRGGRFRVPSDAIEAASYIAAAALTGGELFIDNAPADDLRIVMRTFQRLGIDWHLDDANTQHLRPGHPLGKAHDPDGRRQPHEQKHAEWFPHYQPQKHSQRNGVEQVVDPHVQHRDAGIRKRKDGYDPEGDPGVERMLQLVKRRAVGILAIPHGNEERRDDPGERSVHTALQDTDPDEDPHQEEGRGAGHASRPSSWWPWEQSTTATTTGSKMMTCSGLLKK